jgi:hypothetical protein
MKLTQNVGMRAAKALLFGLLAMTFAWIALAQGVSTTTVQGTVYLANGQPGSGTLQVSWPAFTTSNGLAVTAGRLAATIGVDGFVAINLTPNLGATPAGLFYTAVYHLSDGTTSTEYWVVPAAAQATIASVRTQVMPAAQALQAVNKAYVDQAVASITQSGLASSGGTLTGPLYLSGDPTQALEAADKQYVDGTFAQALPLAGGTLAGPLNAPSVTASVNAQINVMASPYNAKGDCSTDDSTAINAALTAAGVYASSIGAIVYLPTPPGACYLINSQLVIPGNVIMEGAGGSQTVIKAGSSFPANTPMVRLGVGTENNVSSTRAEHLKINCNNTTGCTGLYSNNANENAGAIDVTVMYAPQYGFWIDGTQTGNPGNPTPGHWILRDSGTCCGADVAAVYAADSGVGRIENATFNNAGGVRGIVGFTDNYNSPTMLELLGVHIEGGGLTDNVYLYGSVVSASSLTVLYEEDTGSATNAIHIGTNVSRVSVTSLDTNGTNLIQNDNSGTTIVLSSTNGLLPFYYYKTGGTGVAFDEAWRDNTGLRLNGHGLSLVSTTGNQVPIVTQAGSAGSWKYGAGVSGNDDAVSFYSNTYGPSHSYRNVFSLKSDGSATVDGNFANANGTLIPSVASGYTGSGGVVLSANPTLAGATFSSALYLNGQNLFGNADNKTRLGGSAGGEWDLNYSTGGTGNWNHFCGGTSTCFSINGSTGAITTPSISGMTTPLSTAQGGTGAGSTLTGYVYANGSSAHTASTTIPWTALSGAPAMPAGTIVGTTDTQTLTNKTVDGVAPATLAYMDATSSVQTQLNAKAPLASPALTGTPTAPTQAITTNNTDIATTAAVTTALSSYAPLAAPTFTGATMTLNNSGSGNATITAQGYSIAAFSLEAGTKVYGQMALDSSGDTLIGDPYAGVTYLTFNQSNDSANFGYAVNATGIITGGNDTTRVTSTTIATTSFTTTGLVLPTVPVSTTKNGRCVVLWQMSSTSYTATFGFGMSNAPTGLWGGSEVNYAAANTASWLAFSQTATAATAISTAATAGVVSTTYKATIDFTLQTGSSNAVALTLYGEVSNTSGTLTIMPGSACYWLP